VRSVNQIALARSHIWPIGPALAWNSRRQIADEGRRVLTENRTLINAILSRMGIAARNMAGTRPPEEIYQAFRTLKTAVVLHSRGWSDEEAARFRPCDRSRRSGNRLGSSR
jgi:hypothetical protein